jgi:hypothetical protein
MNFNDVARDKWYYDAVNYAYQNSLLVGMTDIDFEPDRKLSRAMITTILWRLEDEPQVQSNESFKDIARDSWYSKGVLWAEKNGIIFGYEDGEFRADREITREEVVTIIARYISFKDIKTAAKAENFADNSKISYWAKDSVKLLKTLNVINGREGNEFDPKANTTRAETAQLLMNMIENVLKK